MLTDRNANGIIINMLRVKCRLGAIGHVIATDAGVVRAINTMTGVDSVVSIVKWSVSVTTYYPHCQSLSHSAYSRHPARQCNSDARRRALSRGHATVCSD